MYKRIVMVLILLQIVCVGAYGSQFTDTQGHWAEEIIVKWSDLGLISGYGDGGFKPENGITRAEFVTLINNAFGYRQPGVENFKDVDDQNWHYNQVRSALTIGYISGYGDKTFRPDNQVSRQEAAVILTRIMDNASEEKTNYLYRYYDVLKIPEWSWQYLEAAVKAGYLLSYEDQTIRPEQPITRAETVYALEQILGPAYIEDKRYGPESGLELIEGNAVITSADLTLRNTEVQGDLYITEGVGEGDVILDNVKVHGRTIIKGGGTESISLRDSEMNEIYLEKENGDIQLELRGKTTAQTLDVHSGVLINGEKLTGRGLETINVYSGDKDHTITLTGKHRNLKIVSGDMKIKLNDGTMSDIILDEWANNVVIDATNFEIDDIVIGDNKSSTITLKNVVMDEMILKHKQTLNISDSLISTLSLEEDATDSKIDLEQSQVGTFSINCIADFEIFENNFSKFNIKEEAEDINFKITGGTIKDLNIYEKCSLALEDVGVTKCNIKRTASNTHMNLTIDSYIELLKVYAKTNVSGNGEIIEAQVYTDGVSFKETPRLVTANEDIAVSIGSSSYDGYILWTGSLEEMDSNRGILEGAITATLYEDNFTDSIQLGNEVRVTNVPSGLSAEVNRISDTEVEISLEGVAVDHDDSAGVSNVTVTFYTQAFTSKQQNEIKNYSKKNIIINFDD